MREMIKVDSYGGMLKYWRKQRGVNQSELALDCDTSSRHLSCVETERAQPSRHLLLRLCAALEVPLRARNSILIRALAEAQGVAALGATPAAAFAHATPRDVFEAPDLGGAEAERAAARPARR